MLHAIDTVPINLQYLMPYTKVCAASATIVLCEWLGGGGGGGGGSEG